MECPRCGYERQPEDTHCQLCNVDFGLLERQAAEKKMLKEREKQRSGTGEVKEKRAEATKQETASTGKTVGECPNCGFGRREGEVECTNCGIVFEKHEQKLAQQKEAEEARKREEQRRFEEEKARIQREAEKGIAEAKAKREEEAKRKELEAKQAAEMEAAKKLQPADSPKEAAKKIRQPVNTKKIGLGAAAVIAALLIGWGGFSLVKFWIARVEQKRLIAQQEAEKIRIEKEQQRIIADFHTRRQEITDGLRELIDGRKFEEFQEAVKPYEISSLQGELKAVKAYLAEIKLYDSAKWIPAKEYGKNWEIYHTLHQMAPDNSLYAKKEQYYRKQYAERSYRIAKQFLGKKKKYRADLEKAMTAIDKAIELEGHSKRYGKIRYQIQTAQLLFYEGNENIHMAVRNDGVTKGVTGGQRKLFVWLKNVGKNPVFINVDYFTLVGRDNKRYSYNNCSRELIANLQPGEETKGILLFYTSVKPKELIFSHINAGTISRKFP